MCFVDLTKAYDRVLREKLWEIMGDYGMSKWDINLMRELYEGSRVKVEWEGFCSEWLKANSG